MGVTADNIVRYKVSPLTEIWHSLVVTLSLHQESYKISKNPHENEIKLVDGEFIDDFDLDLVFTHSVWETICDTKLDLVEQKVKIPE